MDVNVYDTTDAILRVKVGSSLTDADSTPTASLVSAWPPDAAIDRVMVVTKDSTGVYSAPLLPSDTSVQRELRVDWTYIVSGVTVNRSEYINVIPAYNAIEDLTSVAPDTATPAEILEASRFAQLLIDSVTNQHFDKRYQEFRLRGTDKPQVTLPEQIISVHTIYSEDTLKYDSAAESNDWEITVTPTKYGLTLNVSDDVIQQQLDVVPVWSSSKFYKISGTFGWEYTPSAIQQAHKLLVNDWFCDQSKWKKSYIAEQRSSDWQIKYSGKVFLDTGNFYVDQLLAPFVRQPLVVL